MISAPKAKTHTALGTEDIKHLYFMNFQLPLEYEVCSESSICSQAAGPYRAVKTGPALNHTVAGV